MSIGDYEVHYGGWSEEKAENYLSLNATLRVVKASSGEEVGVAQVEKRSYFARPDEWMTEVGWVPIHAMTGNVYLVLAGAPSDARIPVQVFVNPLVNVIWFGALWMVLASWLLVFPWNRLLRAVRRRHASSQVDRERALESAVQARREVVDP